MKQTLLTAVLLGTLGLSATASADDILETMDRDGGFKTMLSAIKAAGMEDTLKAAGPITVFAPTDGAFSSIPKDKLDALMNDKEALKKLLAHHLVSHKVTRDDVEAGKVDTMDGKSVKLSVAGGVKIDNVPVVAPGMNADNGVIHPMSAVLPVL